MSAEVDLEKQIEQARAERRPHSQIRRLRLKLARLRGQHTPEEWQALQVEFGGRCVRCGVAGMHLDRDHIKPIYQGGSDGIDNIQPLCACCNASKGPEDFNWCEHRRRFGFEEVL